MERYHWTQVASQHEEDSDGNAIWITSQTVLTALDVRSSFVPLNHWSSNRARGDAGLHCGGHCGGIVNLPQEPSATGASYRHKAIRTSAEAANGRVNSARGNVASCQHFLWHSCLRLGQAHGVSVFAQRNIESPYLRRNAMANSPNHSWVSEDEESANNGASWDDATQECDLSDASDSSEIPYCIPMASGPTNGEIESGGDGSRPLRQPIRLGMDSPLGKCGY